MQLCAMQLIECSISYMCVHVDYKNLLASLLEPTIYASIFITPLRSIPRNKAICSGVERT